MYYIILSENPSSSPIFANILLQYIFSDSIDPLQTENTYIWRLLRVRPRFFDQVGHETMYVSSGNRHFFTKSCYRQTYQNYEQPSRTSQNSYFQSHFYVLKIG